MSPWADAFGALRLPPPTVLDTCGSTNAELRRYAREVPNGAAIVAHEQSAGRGRLGRQWTSPAGNLHLSFVVRVRVPPARLPLLGFAAAIATLEAANSPLLRLKWPNDVVTVAPHRKLAGLLLEAEQLPSGDRPAILVIGVGVNVASAPPDLPATALADLGGTTDLPALAAHIVRGTLDLTDLVESDPALLLARYRSLALLGVPVTVSGRPGVALDIDDAGALRFQPDGGPEERVLAGDVALIAP